LASAAPAERRDVVDTDVEAVGGYAVHTVKHLAERVTCAVGGHAVARALRRHELLIVNYHGLRLDTSPHRAWLLLSRTRFVEQLRYLTRHYRIVPIDDALRALDAGTLTEPTACVTFDDGYRNNLTIGLPVLEELRIPATVYLATGLIGTGARLWTTRIELAFAATRQETVDLSALGLGVHRLGDGPGQAARRAHLGHAAKEALKTRQAVERSALVDRLLAALDVDAARDDGEFAFLTWDEVRTLGASGLVTFGGHTVGHEIVSRLDDAAVVREVSESVERARATGFASETFAYPNGGVGDFDGRAVAALRRAGIAAALSTIDGLNTPSTDRYALRRVVVGAEMTLDQFRLHTSGAVSLLRAAGTAAATRMPLPYGRGSTRTALAVRGPGRTWSRSGAGACRATAR
jgi:peptidoglycan/xylan/chitin deacetylase (PgdA/CDA1 family)